MQALSEFYSSPVTTGVKPIPLTDVDGNNTTVVPVTHSRNGNSAMRTWYKIAGVGNGTYNFYADALGQNSFKIADIAIGIKHAGTLKVYVGFEVDGDFYVGGQAYGADTDANLILIGPGMESIPVLDPVAGTPVRIQCVLTDVVGTTNIFGQMLES